MPKSIKLCVEKLHKLIEKECKKMKKDDEYKIDDEAIEKVILNSAPLKRGSKSPDGKPKAKRPLSGYMLFGKKMRPVVLKEHPDYDVTEVMKELGKMWRELSDEEKEKYKV